MRVMLIQPPLINNSLVSLRVEPIALECIAAVDPSHDYAILDMRFDKDPLEKHLEGFGPDVVGITGNTVDFYNMRYVLKRVKAFNGDIFTVVGGHHASARPSDFNSPSVDAIVIGMGEITFNELLDALKGGRDINEIEGLALPSENGLVFTEERPIPKDLDHFLPPRRDLTTRYRKYYRNGLYGMGLINTAKGCPFRCRFCSIWKEMRGRYITKSPEKVLQDLKSIPQRMVRFVDGNTFGNIPRMERLYQLVKESGIKKKYLMDIRSDTIVKNSGLLKKWNEIGLEYVAVGLESMRRDQLDYLNKSVSVESNRKAIQVLHDCNIRIGGLFIIDQHFTQKDFKSILQFVRQSGIQFPFYHILTPLPGTPLFEERKEDLLSSDFEEFDLYHTVLPTDMDERLFMRYFCKLWKDSYSAKNCIQRVLRSMFPYHVSDGQVTRESRPSHLGLLSTYAVLWKRIRDFERRVFH